MCQLLVIHSFIYYIQPKKVTPKVTRVILWYFCIEKILGKTVKKLSLLVRMVFADTLFIGIAHDWLSDWMNDKFVNREAALLERREKLYLWFLWCHDQDWRWPHGVADIVYFDASGHLCYLNKTDFVLKAPSQSFRKMCVRGVAGWNRNLFWPNIWFPEERQEMTMTMTMIYLVDDCRYVVGSKMMKRKLPEFLAFCRFAAVIQSISIQQKNFLHIILKDSLKVSWSAIVIAFFAEN